MKSIARNTYSFEEIIKIGAVYVDKTAHLYEFLKNPAENLFFVARPRRFGKSLMISTLKSLFEGKRELFKGLAIEKTDWAWEKYPVLKFDFSGIRTDTMERFETAFKYCVSSSLTAAGATVNQDDLPEIMFDQAINELYEKYNKQVVILVDEYDAPIGHSLDDIEKAEKIREAMAQFYIQIKKNVGDEGNCASRIRFLMLTGVSRFTKISVFSALNNITDLTFDSRAAALLGYTKEELYEYFSDRMQAHAKVMGLSDEAYFAELKRWYDGLRFSPDCTTKVFNPYAIGITFANQLPNFKPTWSSSGRATALMNYLKGQDLADIDFEKVIGVSQRTIEVCELDNLTVKGMLYQCGCLSIADYEDDRYILAVPNEEIRQDVAQLVAIATHKRNGEAATIIDELRYHLIHAEFDKVERLLKSYYAELVYGPSEETVPESGFQRILYTLLKASGFRVSQETQQSFGRSDLTVTDKRGIFIFELKVDASADAALKQIHEKKYYEPYMSGNAPIYGIGINFDSKQKTRHLTEFKVEKLKD